MSQEALPTIFISHGAPTMPLEDIPAREFLVDLGRRYNGVEAVLCVSAHWAEASPATCAVDEPETIHDFYGFPAELYEIRYPAHGLPELAEKVAGMVRAAGITCDLNRQRGLDHGAWVPMLLMFPDAGVPVVQLSIQSNLDPAGHLALGQAVDSLRHDGILVIGSGGAVHPLGYAPLGPGMPTDRWATEFDGWLTEAVEHGDAGAWLNIGLWLPTPSGPIPTRTTTCHCW